MSEWHARSRAPCAQALQDQPAAVGKGDRAVSNFRWIGDPRDRHAACRQPAQCTADRSAAGDGDIDFLQLSAANERLDIGTDFDAAASIPRTLRR